MSNSLNLFTFFKLFPDQESCFKALVSLKYPAGIWCKKCKKVKNFSKHKTRPVYQCGCGYQESVLKGTIFQGSGTNLQYWFFAIFAMASTRNGLSAMQLQRMLGINYRTCFRMLHKIRGIMKISRQLLTGKVEIDETYFSKSNRRYEENFENELKGIIMGFVERGGQAIFEMIPNTGKYTIIEQMQKHVEKTAHVITDQGRWYEQLKKHGYKHDYVLHRKEYVKKDNPEIYTQTIESLWSQYKRNLLGTYRGGISVKYFPNYNNEYTWNYSNRKKENRFELLLSAAIGG